MATGHDARTLIACAQVLALAAMAGVYLVPRRVLVILRDFVEDRRRIPLGAAWLLFVASAAPALLAISLGAAALPRMLSCLAGDGCGGSRVGGLLALFLFGLAVIVMQGASFAAWLIHRATRYRSAA